MSEPEQHDRLVLAATVRDTWFADITATARERGWDGDIHISTDVLCGLVGHEHKSDRQGAACRSLWNRASLDASRLAALLDDALEARHEADQYEQWLTFASGRDFTEFDHTSPLPDSYPPGTLFALVRENDLEGGPWSYRIDQRHQPATKESQHHA